MVIVTPFYDDQESFAKLIVDLKAQITSSFRVVVVDDGSLNNPTNKAAYDLSGLNLDILKLKRNVGHQKAIAIGLNYVQKNYINDGPFVIMDSDGEDSPSSINLLVESLNEECVDAVVATRKSRVESYSFLFFYAVYKWIFKILVGRKIDFGNFIGLSRTSLERVTQMPETWIHFAAAVLVSKVRLRRIPIARSSRYEGKSKANFVSQVLHGFRALMVFAENVLVRVGLACAFVAIVAVILMLLAISLKFLGYATPGWFSVVMGILLLMFLQTGALTLMTLMLTGVVRNGTIQSVDYIEFIKSVEKING